MARKVRIEYAGAVYHVMARGNRGQEIFVDEADRRMWRMTLGEACEKAGWRIHAYVMMNNHYHLLVETPAGNLVAGMKWLQSTYTQRYNSRHRVFGHLFQGRYKALVVDGEQGNYFGVVSTYVHLNPARAGLIRIGKDRLKEYGGSSYPLYLKDRRRRPQWLVTERVMGDLGLGATDAGGYEAYLEARVLELGMKEGRRELNEQWKRIRRGWYLGGDGFRARMLQSLKWAMGRGLAASYSGEAKREHGEAEAAGLLGRGLKALGMAEEDLVGTPKNLRQKQVLAWWLRQRTTVGRRWLSQRLCMGEESGVTRSVRMLKSTQDIGLARLKRQLLKDVPEDSE
jgi:putative transposase